MTGTKAQDKKYYRHSGYPGGIYERTFTEMQQQFPERVLEKTVRACCRKARWATPCWPS